MKLDTLTKGQMIARGAAIILLLCHFIASAPEASAQTTAITPPDSVSATAGSTLPAQHHRGIHRTRTQVVDPNGNSTTSDSISKNIVDMAGDTVYIADMDSVQKHAVEAELLQRELQAKRDSADFADYGRQRAMKINPMRSLWLSALCPGLGQVYNRRYWKLPIVVGGFVGLGYAISWNNKMLKDYTKAYNDIMDNDPNTKSYMDFYPPTVDESEIDTEWLKRSLKSKKDYFRRNRDLCVISIVGVYLICMVDAYVDATMSKFDISDDLSMKVRPTFIEQSRSALPGVGVACAISF